MKGKPGEQSKTESFDPSEEMRARRPEGRKERLDELPKFIAHSIELQ